MRQSKRQSLLESLSNVTVGFLITMISLHLIFPTLGIESHAGKNVVITVFLTILSIIRTYLLRRFFERRSSQH